MVVQWDGKILGSDLMSADYLEDFLSRRPLTPNVSKTIQRKALRISVSPQRQSSKRLIYRADTRPLDDHVIQREWLYNGLPRCDKGMF